jgi:hypothetical protein
MHFALALVCSATIFINASKLPVTDHDRDFVKYMQRAHTCAARYKKSPCLKRVVKLGFQNYYLECGAAK